MRTSNIFLCSLLITLFTVSGSYSQENSLESKIKFFKSDVLTYVGLGMNSGGDYPSDYKHQLLSRGFQDVKPGFFITLDWGLEFRFIDKFYIGGKAKGEFNVIKVSGYDTFFKMKYESTNVKGIYSGSIYGKYFIFDFDRSGLFVAGGVNIFDTFSDEEYYKFTSDGIGNTIYLGYEFRLGGRYLGIELGFSSYPVKINKNSSLNFGGIEFSITGGWNLGNY